LMMITENCERRRRVHRGFMFVERLACHYQHERYRKLCEGDVIQGVQHL
jgi:hypothetical protein